VVVVAAKSWCRRMIVRSLRRPQQEVQTVLEVRISCDETASRGRVGGSGYTARK